MHCTYTQLAYPVLLPLELYPYIVLYSGYFKFVPNRSLYHVKDSDFIVCSKIRHGTKIGTWLIMWSETDVSELRLPTGLLFIPRVNMSVGAMVMMVMPAGDNSRLVYYSSLVVLPAETSGASRKNGRRKEIFAYSVPLTRQLIFSMP
jgi:hypothetical protein